MPNSKLAIPAIAICGLLQIHSPQPASAEQVVWFGNRSEDGASLVYGTPNSGYGKIAFSCEAGEDDVHFVYEHKPIRPEEGVQVEVFLAAGGVEIAIPTTGGRLEIDDAFLLEGQTKLDDNLRKILTAGGQMIVTVEDGAEEFPLDGAAEAAKHLLQVCSPNG
mgnify:FL=1